MNNNINKNNKKEARIMLVAKTLRKNRKKLKKFPLWKKSIKYFYNPRLRTVIRATLAQETPLLRELKHYPLKSR
jgi:hypothetical protein